MVRNAPFKTVFVIDEAKKKSIFAITQNIDLVNERRKKGGGGGGGARCRPTQYQNAALPAWLVRLPGWLLDEHLGCTCLYDDGSGTDPRDVDTNGTLDSLPR
ncbi:hypothetical protein SAMN05216420_102233 [Nitrosospira sp. Nl5]|nr:hypothetical protein SAMN05216420_102233 [Nitrosospira sp. Nl5]